MSQTISSHKYYDSISKGYDELHGREQLKKIKIVKKIIINNIVDADKSINDYKILDIGCGPGFSEIISKNIVGIDPSIELLKKARIKKVNGVAENLPFKHDVFDIIISVTSIHNFNNVKQAIKEMKRVSNEKSYFIITVLQKSPKLDSIENIIKNNFKIKGIIKEEKDFIFFCEG